MYYGIFLYCINICVINCNFLKILRIFFKLFNSNFTCLIYYLYKSEECCYLFLFIAYTYIIIYNQRYYVLRTYALCFRRNKCNNPICAQHSILFTFKLSIRMLFICKTFKSWLMLFNVLHKLSNNYEIAYQLWLYLYIKQTTYNLYHDNNTNIFRSSYNVG